MGLTSLSPRGTAAGRCHCCGRWLHVTARLPLRAPAGFSCHLRDGKRLRWDMGWGQSGMGQGQGAPPWADPGQQQRTPSGLGAVAEHLTGAARRRGQKVGPLWRVVKMRMGGLRARRGGAAGVLAVLRAPPDLFLHARDISVSMHPTFQRVLPRGSALGEIPSGVMEPVGNYPCSKHVHPSLEPGSPVRGSWGQRVFLMARSDTSCQHTTQELAGVPVCVARPRAWWRQRQQHLAAQRGAGCRLELSG